MMPPVPEDSLVYRASLLDKHGGALLPIQATICSITTHAPSTSNPTHVQSFDNDHPKVIDSQQVGRQAL